MKFVKFGQCNNSHGERKSGINFGRMFAPTLYRNSNVTNDMSEYGKRRRRFGFKHGGIYGPLSYSELNSSNFGRTNKFGFKHGGIYGPLSHTPINGNSGLTNFRNSNLNNSNFGGRRSRFGNGSFLGSRDGIFNNFDYSYIGEGVDNNHFGLYGNPSKYMSTDYSPVDFSKPCSTNSTNSVAFGRRRNVSKKTKKNRRHTKKKTSN